MANPCVIFNPGAGSADESDAFREKVEQSGQLDFCKTEREGHAAELAIDAAKKGRPAVVAAGGDGTVSEVVTGLMRARESGEGDIPALCIAPLGTGNDLGRTAGMPEDPCDVLDALLAERTIVKKLDVMQWTLDEAVDGPPRQHSGWAVNVIAGGFSSQLQDSLTPELKKTWGPLAYLRAALSTAQEVDPFDLAMSIDGRPIQRMACLNLVVANARYAGGGIDVAPNADPGDGQINLVIVSPGEALSMAGFGLDLFSGEVLENERTVNVHGKSFVLESDPPMPFNIDGDRVGKGRLTVKVLPGVLPVHTLPTDDAA